MKRFILYFFISLFTLVIAMEYGISGLLESVFAKHLNQYYISLVSGTFSMIEEDLLSEKESEWPARMSGLQSVFDYPVKLVNIHDNKVSKYELKVLNTGRIMVKGNADIFQKRITDSDYILVVGPFPEPGLKGLIDVIVYALVLLLILIFTLLWSFSFKKHFSIVNKTATAFSNGDLNARIDISGNSYFKPIATTFNNMADRISRLILSHKDMTNSIAHELRTPVSRLLFGLEMVEASVSDQERKSALTEIRSDIDELDALITEMLTFAKLERVLPETALTPVEPFAWFQKISEKYQQVYQGRIHFASDSVINNCRVMLDAKLMERALSNLMINAAKHADQQIRVSISDSEETLIIKVEDDGSGIPEKDREKIFEPFRRLDSSRNKATGGYGLGLAIVKTIVTLHNGTISVGESELSGASFQIELPLIE